LADTRVPAGPATAAGPAAARPRAAGAGRGARSTRTRVAALLGCTLLLVVVCVVGLVAGSKVTSAADVVAALQGHGDEYVRTVVDSRVPRTLLGVVVGAALAVSGVLIQGITRNPLGDPGLLGVHVGASAAVVTATAFLGFGGGRATVWVALPGALLTVLVVYLVGGRRTEGSAVPLVLTGAVVSAVLGSYIQGVTLQRPQVFDSYRYWVVGSLAGRDLSALAEIAPFVVAGLVLACVLASGLNVLALGEATATALGARTAWVRAGGILAAAVLSAAATAAIGPIAFVGLAVPHVVRAVVGGDHRWQLPFAVVLGGVLLVGSDIVGRVVARPEELMVGVVTAFVGAPFLLYAVRRARVGS
jgi:iron complex transport system permease protein